MIAPATFTSSADPVQNLLEHLLGVKSAGQDKWSAKCPAHDDQHNSLGIAKGRDGRALVTCRAGCTMRAVCEAAGVTVKSLFPDDSGRRSTNGTAKRIVATYDYCDRDGELLYQKVRYSPKGFVQRRPDGSGGWTFKLGDVQRVLYRWADQIDELDPSTTVFLTEGEKAVDKLVSLGVAATCTSEGANKWGKAYTEALRGWNVVILPDNDPPGRSHAKLVGSALADVAASVRVLELPELPDKGDVYDWIDASHTSDELLQLAANAPQAASVPPNEFADPLAALGDLEPMQLAELWRTNPNLREPVLDGLIRRGQVGNLISTSKSYKTYLILGLAVSFVSRRLWLERFAGIGGRVLLVDLELQPGDITRRTIDICNAMNVNAQDVASKIDVLSLRGRAATVDEIERMLLGYQSRAYSLVIIDPLYKTYPPDFDENNNAAMTALYRRWERLAEHLDAGLWIVHHGTKGSQADKRTVDVGAGASAQSRSADCHVALREHDAEGCVVFDARIRSFAPLVPFVMRWEYPLWSRDELMDATNLKHGHKSRNADKPQPLPAEPPPEPWTPGRFVAEFASNEPREQKLLISRAELAGVSARQAPSLCRLAIADGLLHRWTFANDKRVVYLATVEQPVTATSEAPK